MLTKNDLKQIQGVVRTEMSSLQQDIKTLRKDVTQVRKDTKMIVSFFDREYLELRKRVERIEEHLHLQITA